MKCFISLKKLSKFIRTGSAENTDMPISIRITTVAIDVWCQRPIKASASM